MLKKKLFIIHNHKNFSGAARSLGETIENLRKKINFIVICPKGSSSNFFKSLNIKVLEVKLVPRLNHFKLGYYRGFRWIVLFREIYALIYFFFFLKKLKLNFKSINHFHLNELELIIISPLLKFFFDTKITSHLRSTVENNKGKLRYKFLKFLTNKYIDKIIAIDNDCMKTSPNKKKTIIIYNGINKKNILIKKRKKNIITFGFIGNFIKRKGIYETLSVFKKISKNHKLKLVCVGQNKYQNEILNFFKFEKKFQKYLIKNNILSNNSIQILPMTFNLKNFYSKIDVILFPGFMNAVGRPVIEAALIKKPSIIALNQYNNDTAMKNNCLIFKPGNLISFEKKILYLIKNKSLIKKMGLSAYKNAKKKFDICKNSVAFSKVL